MYVYAIYRNSYIHRLQQNLEHDFYTKFKLKFDEKCGRSYNTNNLLLNTCNDTT
jgi:hypothetical protein